MAAELPGERLTVQDLVEPTGFCADCTLARAFAQSVVEGSRIMDMDKSEEVIQRHVGFISLCPRKKPVPSPDSDPCSTISSDRRCLHENLNDIYGTKRVEKVSEILGVDQ